MSWFAADRITTFTARHHCTAFGKNTYFVRFRSYKSSMKHLIVWLKMWDGNALFQMQTNFSSTCTSLYRVSKADEPTQRLHWQTAPFFVISLSVPAFYDNIKQNGVACIHFSCADKGTKLATAANIYYNRQRFLFLNPILDKRVKVWFCPSKYCSRGLLKMVEGLVSLRIELLYSYGW